MILWFKRYLGPTSILILPCAVILSWLSPWAYPEAFCKSGEPCVQAWVSALSGWAAAIAAYITIRTMNRQRAEANRYQRENVELEIMGRLALARKLLGFLLLSKAECARKIGRLRSAKFDYVDEFENFNVFVANIEAAMQSPIINEYAEKIGFDRSLFAQPPAGRAERIIEAAERYRHSAILYPLMPTQSLAADGSDVAEKIIKWNTDCIGYFDLLEEDVKKFNARWRQKINESDDT